MVKRFILGFLMICLYMALYAVVMLIYIQFVMGGLSGEVLMVGNAIVFGGAFVFFLPWFFWSTHVVWFFKGEGSPVPLEKLRAEILAIRALDIPITVVEKGQAISVTWKYQDAKWWEFFAKAGAQQSYELLIKFNEAKKEVRLIDITRSMHWRAGLSDLSFGFGFFRGIVMQYEIGKAWGIRENFTVGKIYDYSFNPSTIKTPVMNTILRAGWNVRFGMI